MKKTYLSIFALFAGLIGLGQSAPNSVNIGLFANGANGSDTRTGGNIEVALKLTPGRLPYSAIPVAEDFVLYLVAPKSDFSTRDALIITEVNPALYGESSEPAMLAQGAHDVGAFDPDNLYFPVVLNSQKGMNLSSLSEGRKDWTFAFTFKFNNAKSLSSLNKIRIVDQTNNTAISNFNGQTLASNLQMTFRNQLTNTAVATLPEDLLSLSGYKNGSKNVLNWTVAGEMNNRGFDLQRSTDGTNYSSIGFVNSIAPGGFSNSELSYTFDDGSPVGKIQYYRLRQEDIAGRSKLSNIVLITGDKPTSLAIGGLFPNPARSIINVIIDAPARDNVTLMVTDVNGKMVKQQLANVETGSNTIPVEISQLAQGSYHVKVICKSECETAVAKFNKQ